MGAAGTKEPRRVPQFTQNVFVAAFTVPQAGHAIEADKRYPRRASRRELVEPCGGWPTGGHVISSENRAGSFIRNRRNFAHSPRNAMDINQLGLVLMGTVLGWFLLFAVRRYKVQWGAFAAFMAIVFGVSMMSFLYARDLLAYYGIGIFIGFVSNMIVRVAGTTAGGKFGEGLLEISAFERKE